MMAKQPGFQNSSYLIFDATFELAAQFNDKERWSDWSDDQWKSLQNSFQTCFDNMQAELADAEAKGNQVFIKEHVIFMGPNQMLKATYGDADAKPPILVHNRDEPESVHTSPSSLPDSVLLTLQPIFQIRHPILMFPSFLRSQIKMKTSERLDRRVTAMSSLRFSRQLYEWYLNQGEDTKPKVIDADDIMTNKAAVRQLCLETGLDPDSVQYEWSTRDEPDPLKKIMTDKIIASTGILPGLEAQGLDFETEKAKWKAEFGDEDGETMAKLVQDAMPDYEYLHSRRVGAVQPENP